jgi:hypothetical protein
MMGSVKIKEIQDILEAPKTNQESMLTKHF